LRGQLQVSPSPVMKTICAMTCVVLALVSSGCTSKEAARLVPEGAKLEVCPVHNFRTRTERVPIHYGLMAFPVGYGEARKACFPNAWRDIAGGCIPERPTKAKVHYCPKCREEEQKWRNAHARSSG